MASSPKKKAPESTLEEARYLKHLADSQLPVVIRLEDGEEVRGVIEFYDANLIRLTREDGPNLFLYKHDIKYLWEWEQ